MFPTECGAAINLDWISRRFKAMTVEAGLRVIKFHATRRASLLPIGANSATLGPGLSRLSSRARQLFRHRLSCVTDGLDETGSTRTMTG